MSQFKALLDLFMPAIYSEAKLLASQVIPLTLPRLTQEQVCSLCKHVSKILKDEPTMLDLYSPITVVGDIHGHILDLFRILNKCGMPPRRKYVFLGDLVDRGEFSIETVIVILLLKAVYSDHVYIIRGNHEFDFLCQQCGFFNEVVTFYEEPSVYNACTGVFSYLPLAAKIDNCYLCVHGGIGPNFMSLMNFRTVHRPIDDFGEDDFIDSVLWSDPTNDFEQFEPSTRGSGYFFGASAVSDFNEKNGIMMIIRGHECVNDGIEFHFNKKLVTVFSASNYCGLVGNKAAVLEITSPNNFNTHDFPPLPYLKRSDAFFGVHPPDGPRSAPGRPVTSSRRQPIQGNAKDKIEYVSSLGALPRCPEIRCTESLPPLQNRFSNKKCEIVRPPIAHSPRRRRRSNVF